MHALLQVFVKLPVVSEPVPLIKNPLEFSMAELVTLVQGLQSLPDYQTKRTSEFKLNIAIAAWRKHIKETR